MLNHDGRAVTAIFPASLRCGRAAALIGATLLFAPGCSLIPTWDDVSSATSYVKDTVTGKAKRDRQTQAFAEARIMERRKDYAGAEKLYRELLAEKPDSRDCYHRLAVMASMQHKYPEAHELYQKALQCGSPTADLWNDLGYFHYLQHQMPEAEGAFKQALALTPQHRSSMNNLAMVIGEQGNLDEAYRLFRQANDEGEAEANFAYLCAQCGDLPRAQQHYSRALNCNPEMKNALEGMFQVTQRMQRMQQMQPGQPEVSADGVQLASHNGQPQRPLIEVFTGAPPRPTAPNASLIPSSASPNAGAVQQAGGIQQPGNVQPTGGVQQAGGMQPQTPPAPPTRPTLLYNTPTSQNSAPNGPPQPQPAGLMPGAASSAPVPYSFQGQPQPQYLQPSIGPRVAQQGGPPPSAASQGAPSSNANQSAAAALNAGGPFPPLVGGATATR